MPQENLHDKLFKQTFSSVKEIRAFILHFLDEKIYKELDLSTLQLANVSYIDAQLQEYFSDIVCTCRTRAGGTAEVSFLLEHKSYYDERLSLQMLRYLLKMYDYQNRQSKHKPFDFVLPVLLYHGRPNVTHKEFIDLINVPSPELNAYIPTFKYEVVDLNKLSDEFILSVEYGYFMQSTLLLFKHKNDKEYLLQNSDKIFTFVKRDLAKDELDLIIHSLLTYIFRVFEFKNPEYENFHKKLDDMVQAKAGSMYAKWQAEGRQKGRQEGRQEGKETGKNLTSVLVLIKIFKSMPDIDKEAAANLANISKKQAEKLYALLTKNKVKKATELIVKEFFVVGELNMKDIAELKKGVTAFYKNA